MKKVRQQQRRRLWVEELEPRVVLSPVAALSTNWSGYAAQTSLTSPASNAVTAVYGSWNVPAVTGTGNAYTAVWVGIDGYTSNTVEQIGTESDIVNGVPTYYAWYETYPNPTIDIPLYNAKTKTGLTVNANDAITASVAYSGKSFTLTLTDTTSNESYSPPAQTVKSAQRSSAEWVVEAPSSNGGILPLANFGTTTFTNASATINGTQSTIDGYNAANPAQPLWQYTPINMTTSRGQVQATTGSLTDTTTTTPATSSFAVTYSAPATTQPTPPLRNHGGGGAGNGGGSGWGGGGWGWGWGWHSANTPFSDGITVQSYSDASIRSAQAASTFSPAVTPTTTAVPPIAGPINTSPAPAIFLTGPTEPVPADAADALLMDAKFGFSGEFVPPSATPNAFVESAPSQVIADAVPNAALVSEAPAVSSAPPASQPEQDNFFMKSFGKAFWLVAGFALFSSSEWARGKRRHGSILGNKQPCWTAEIGLS